MEHQSSAVQGKVALITGANTGIGRITALELARAGWLVVLAGRSRERTQPVLDAIAALPQAAKPLFLPLELGSLASVRACAAAFLALGLPLHLLVNNAGLAGARGLTQDGFEIAFGVNHLGHFLLTSLLLERLRASAPARVVNVASRAHLRAPAWDWEALRQPTRTRTGIREYAVSKLANVLFSAELARRLEGSGVSSYALHPGVVATDVWRAVPSYLRFLLRWRGFLTPQQGAQTSLYCALAAPQTESGLYYADSKVCVPSRAAQDGALAQQLWQRSAQWVA